MADRPAEQPPRTGLGDDLYDRYMAARAVHQGHRADCAECTDRARCPAGQTVFESFARLQDAYLNRQHQQRRQR